MSLRDYLHTLDRHKSIDNCFLSPSTDDRLYLFDEIKKITNHLFKITATPDPLPHSNGDASEHEMRASNDRVHDMNIQNLNITQTTPLDTGTLEEGVKSDIKTCDDMMDENNNSKINDVNDGSARSHPFSEIFKKFTSLADSGTQVNDTSNAPWRNDVSTKRTKFRINQMSSRDVPIIKTERPAKLKKQNAIDAADTRLFDEQINHKSIFHKPKSSLANSYGIVDLLESFEHDRSQMLKAHFRHKTFVDRMANGSISFDCGQIGVEQRSMSTIRSLFQLHATTGRNVKQIQAQIEAKNK